MPGEVLLPRDDSDLSVGTAVQLLLTSLPLFGRASAHSLMEQQSSAGDIARPNAARSVRPGFSAPTGAYRSRREQVSVLRCRPRYRRMGQGLEPRPTMTY
jgi:hypothetical protein